MYWGKAASSGQPAHVDMGLIYGVGFPPFKGGIFTLVCDGLGADKVVKTAEMSDTWVSASSRQNA